MVSEIKDSETEIDEVSQIIEPGEYPKDYMEINFGPHHPSTHGVFRFIAKVDGEKIIEVEPIIGYLHRGIEKMAESRTYYSFKPLVDRLDYTGAMNNELGYCLSVEKLMELEVPERAQAIRVICAELNRISAHEIFFGAMGLEAGAFTPFLFGFRDREISVHLMEMLAGGRLTFNFFTIGGVRMDIPQGFYKETKDFLKKFEKSLEEYHELFSGNEIFIKRTRDVGIISKEDAIAWSMSGPTLRGSGIKFDIRKVEPYSGYDKYDWEVPAGSNGDVYDRYWVRMNEMRQSARIIGQALDLMPAGDYQAKVPKIIKPPAGEIYFRTEGTKGEVG
ncbi:MAG: NADH-quinone oxidoreductase subunit D, partial [Actinobacteria bacterium]|nr:NADH-quinone oxidoreductase subunit D [Actinomycetota bacterium]